MVFLYSLVIGAFATVCCLWFVVFGLLFMVCCLWFGVYGLLSMVWALGLMNDEGGMRNEE
jgi:hypothetical protein